MKEKNYIPSATQEGDKELPDGDFNSLVDKYGNNNDDGYNFDEKDDEPEEPEESEKPNESEYPEFNPEKAKEL